jgi:hypothetical protein
VAFAVARSALGAESPCPLEGGDAVAIHVAHHELWLCMAGIPAARFRVAIGRGGPGKARAGDNRTPIGTYALGDPRPSARFGTFIPIAYPTIQQASAGFTGGAIGIHGPPRGLDPKTWPLAELDWTEGCIATATDDEVAAIAAFVRERAPHVVIR